MTDPRPEAQAEAERSFAGFMRWTKITVWGSLAVFLAVASCNFGVDGTGGKYDPSQDLKDEYKSNMGLD